MKALFSKIFAEVFRCAGFFRRMTGAVSNRLDMMTYLQIAARLS